MLVEVLYTFLQTVHVRFLDFIYIYPTVHLQSLGCSHDDGQFRLKSGFAAFDVVELLCTQVGTESGFCYDIVTESHRQFGSQYRVTSVCDVGKRTTVYEGRCMFRSLYQVRRQGIFQQYRNRSSYS